jgi:hypothetical protein
MFLLWLFWFINLILYIYYFNFPKEDDIKDENSDQNLYQNKINSSNYCNIFKKVYNENEKFIVNLIFFIYVFGKLKLIYKE